MKATKALLLMRHAKSSWKEPLPDHDRPLKKRGRRDAPKIGHFLRRKKLVPQLILTSTARRAVETASLVAEACGYEGEIVQDARLYHAELETILEILRELDEAYERVLVVSHNPEIEMWVEHLAGEAVHMPTAALAYILLPLRHWAELDTSVRGTLVSVWTPRELPS